MSLYSLPSIQELRAIKSQREVALIVKAQRISEQVLGEAVKKLRVGIKEIELARFIVARFKHYGIKALAFEPIVAFGKGSADIHHWATHTRLKHNQIVMLDFGCAVNGYCSDMTRTFWFGTPTAKFKKVYSAVLQAQERALDFLAQGEKKTAKIDASARKFLHHKFGKKSFTHGLGHGIGTAIHEWPNFKPASVDILKPNMVMTVEPGVYLPGWGGVRIEDMVVIKQQGILNLTKAAKSLPAMIIKV
jgi:Xaa-Pro aminopeptidase